MARRVMGHGDAVCWFCCRDETNGMRPDAVRWFCCFFCSTLLLSMRYHEVHNKLKRSHESRKLWSQNQPPKKQDSEFVSYVLDAIARGQEKIGTNFKESDSDELDDSFAPPTKKPRLMWRQELHQQFVEDVMQIGLDKAKPKRIVEAMNIPGLTREQVASHLQKHRHELLLNTSKGVTLQQNEKTLSNNIESKRREGAYGRFDLTAFGDTSHLSYAALHPEERMEDQWPYYSLA
ncbi:hypothetical protein JHK85_053272 [Glycine max]|nr:hypothetical protein JHK85_053272 [Glycine max]